MFGIGGDGNLRNNRSIYMRNARMYNFCLFDMKISSFSFSFRRHAELLNGLCFTRMTFDNHLRQLRSL
jgi:hypothetical protein